MSTNIAKIVSIWTFTIDPLQDIIIVQLFKRNVVAINRKKDIS